MNTNITSFLELFLKEKDFLTTPTLVKKDGEYSKEIEYCLNKYLIKKFDVKKIATFRSAFIITIKGISFLLKNKKAEKKAVEAIKDLFEEKNKINQIVTSIKQDLNEIKKLNEEELADKEYPTYNERDIILALKSENPYMELKNVFDRKFLPKVVRWIEKKVKNIKVSEEEKNKVGGEFKAKIRKYLEADGDERNYNENVEMFVRDLLTSINKWHEYKNKPFDLPL